MFVYKRPNGSRLVIDLYRGNELTIKILDSDGEGHGVLITRTEVMRLILFLMKWIVDSTTKLNIPRIDWEKRIRVAKTGKTPLHYYDGEIPF